MAAAAADAEWTMDYRFVDTAKEQNNSLCGLSLASKIYGEYISVSANVLKVDKLEKLVEKFLITSQKILKF